MKIVLPKQVLLFLYVATNSYNLSPIKNRTSLSAIAADIPGFDLNAKFKIKSYTVLTLANGILAENKCTGNNFSPEAKGAVSKVKTGGRIFLEDIIVIGPDGKEMPLNNVTVKIKS